nr:sensor domain-containing diguanylate cyclase [Thalassobacillus pellis]
MKEVENRYRSLVEMSPDAVFVHNEQDRIIYLNDAGVQLVNAISKEDMVGQNIYRFIHTDSASTIKERIKSILATGMKSGPNTHCFHKVDGTPFFVEIHAARVEYGGKFAVQTICRDITERKEQQDQLRILAYRDQLTEIYNRRFFFSKMQEEVEQASEINREFAIVYLDFDNFKEINDTHGHFVGDETLIIITRRVKKILRKEDVFARIGGDEFVILLPGANHGQVKRVAQRILDQVLKPVILNRESFHVTVSIGVSLFPLHGSDGQELISYADKALYQAKGSGKNRVCIYDPAKKYS